MPRSNAIVVRVPSSNAVQLCICALCCAEVAERRVRLVGVGRAILSAVSPISKRGQPGNVVLKSVVAFSRYTSRT
jgi:hypothetical protein